MGGSHPLLEPPALLAGMGQHQDGAHRLSQVFLWRSRTQWGQAELALLSSSQLSLAGQEQGWGWGCCAPAHSPSQLLDRQEQLLCERGHRPADDWWGQVGAAVAASAALGVPSPSGLRGHDLSPGCPAELGPGSASGLNPETPVELVQQH